MRKESLKTYLRKKYDSGGYRFRLRRWMEISLDEIHSPGQWAVMLAQCAYVLEWFTQSATVETLQNKEAFLEISANCTVRRLQACRDGMVTATQEYRRLGRAVPQSDMLKRVERAKSALIGWRDARGRFAEKAASVAA